MRELGNRHYHSNLVKGGALVTESLRLLAQWSADDTLESFRERMLRENVIARTTRSRLVDIINRVFGPRYLAENVPEVENLQFMVVAQPNAEVVYKLLLYHAALADDLFYDFITERLFELYQAGRYRLDVSDAVTFIDERISRGTIASNWSAEVRLRAAQGLLATARDFGLLEGKVQKRFLPAHLPFEVFIYALYHLKDQGITANRILEHPHWRLFLLAPSEVERLLLEAHQRDFIRYNAAGNVVRIDWLYEDQEGAVHALAARASAHA